MNITNNELAKLLRDKLEQDGVSKEFLDEKFIILTDDEEVYDENNNWIRVWRKTGRSRGY